MQKIALIEYVDVYSYTGDFMSYSLTQIIKLTTYYILARQVFRNTILNSKVYAGVDCSSDHNLVVTRLRMRMKKFKTKKPVEKLDLTEITKGDKSQYQCKTNIALNAINQENMGYTSKRNKVKEQILNIGTGKYGTN